MKTLSDQAKKRFKKFWKKHKCTDKIKKAIREQVFKETRI